MGNYGNDYIALENSGIGDCLKDSLKTFIKFPVKFI